MQSSQKTIQKKEEIKLPTEKPTKNTSSNTDMGNIWVKTASAKPETCISTRDFGRYSQVIAKNVVVKFQYLRKLA